MVGGKRPLCWVGHERRHIRSLKKSWNENVKRDSLIEKLFTRGSVSREGRMLLEGGREDVWGGEGIYWIYSNQN